jgi:hypothetical protein
MRPSPSVRLFFQWRSQMNPLRHCAIEGVKHD